MTPNVRNRVFLLIDVVGWVLLPIAALALRLDGFRDVGSYAQHLVLFSGIAIIAKTVVLWGFGLYRRYWKYATVDELISIIVAVVLAGIVVGASYFALVAFGVAPEGPRLPRSVPALDALLSLLFVGGSRFSLRAAGRLRQRGLGRNGGKPAIVIGAGGAGLIILRELYDKPQDSIDLVGFVDDDPAKQGRTIYGLPVLGTREVIPQVARGLRVRMAIIAMPTVPGSVIREIRAICDEAGLEIKTVPGAFDIISGRVRVSELRDVQIEDLLRRAAVQTDQAAVRALVTGRRILVTGAGGSIGSEICRQAAGFGASSIVLLGHGENPIFDINNELGERFPELEVVPVIADIRDRDRIRRVFGRYRPALVFHAAAHKHVPLMEVNPEEAVTNNVFGTANVIAEAEAAGVERFVLVSTDKAVNPVNIMGATKKLAESLTQRAATANGKTFVAVRFGNVLGSSGSVVPVFQRQIAAGGPVTITDPQISRYFMTIPEAVQLVLQAASMGSGGETFVLDMGEPVRISDLARDLIELSGLAESDIDLVYTGLRPGEKMSEELVEENEILTATRHAKVRVAQRHESDPREMLGFPGVAPAIERRDLDTLLAILREHFPKATSNGIDGGAPSDRQASEGVGVDGA